MFRSFRLPALMLICSLFGNAAAQDAERATSAIAPVTITASASAGRVRFIGYPAVVQIRLEAYDAMGRKMVDYEVRGGNVLDWHLEDGQAQHLANDAYLCVVTVKSISGKLTQQIGSLTIEGASALLRPADPAHLTVQQVQTVGPVEGNASLTVLKEGETTTTTVIAHNGDEGQLIRGRGALSFRLGDFFAGTDKEQMRLSAEGNLGIGTSDPQAKLDVNGIVSAREGFMFSDGSTLNVNKKGVLTHRTNKGDVSANAAGIGTLNRLAKWTDSAGTLGDSIATEVGGTGLQLTAPVSGSTDTNILFLDSTSKTMGMLAGSTPSFVAANGPYFAMRGSTYNTIPNQRGLFSISTGNVTNPVGNEGSVLFITGPDQIRMSIKPSGNIGIGTTGPLSKLHIVSGTSDLPPRLQSSGSSSFAAGWDFYLGNIGKGYVGVPDAAAGFGGGELLIFGGPGTKTSLWAGSNRSVTIDTNGNVGIGTTTTSLARLQVSDTSFGTGIYGTTTTNGRGVTGENLGSSGGTGVLGSSASGSGVIGQATASLFPGVQGTNNSVSGIGVLGTANGNGGVGVYGRGDTNIGVYGQSANGFAMRADGNTFQQRDKYGWAKAMVYVYNGQIQRCYNGLTGASLQNGSSADGCGFHVDHPDLGLYFIDFGFLITDRFYALSQRSEDLTGAGEFHIINLGCNFNPISDNVLRVSTFYNDDRETKTNGRFMVIVF